MPDFCVHASKHGGYDVVLRPTVCATVCGGDGKRHPSSSRMLSLLWRVLRRRV